MKKINKLNLACIGLFFLSIVFCKSLFASEGGDLVERTSGLVFQLSIIIFAVLIGGALFERLKLPSVLGEIVAGVVIGPYCLGSISLPGFAHGIFPLQSGFPVSIELYSLATIASILLLFLAGLETDLDTFVRYSFVGTVVGVGGVIFSFIAGDLLGVMISKPILGVQYGFFHSVPLFLGVISTATSVGISARILSAKKKMNSPEGVVILSSAVIDDVLGIIILAVVIGMVKSNEINLVKVSFIALKAVSIWLGFTFLGLKYAHDLSLRLKNLKSRGSIAIISFALALFLAGIFEKSGLAMIIGAYVMGLSLSKTDLAFIIQEKLETVQRFLVPIFFCVMGMLINIGKFADIRILGFGVIYIVLAVLGKMIGCGIPALFLNFNRRGALRIGVGMIPRGEVALIIAGIGLSFGIIKEDVFSIVMLMTFVTTLITPLILDKMLESTKPVLRKETKVKKEQKSIVFEMPNSETADLLLARIIGAFENEGFFVHRMEISSRIYNIRKNKINIVLTCHDKRFVFDCLEREATFIHTLLYEVIGDVERYMKQLQEITEKQNIGRKIFSGGGLKGAKPFSFEDSVIVKLRLKGETKQEVLKELVGSLIEDGVISSLQSEDILEDLYSREMTMSTGMQDGIALPHVKTDFVDRLSIVFGVSEKGVEFSSLDKKPAQIFCMTLIPRAKTQPYLQVLSEISKFLMHEENRQDILSCKTSDELTSLLTQRKSLV